MKQLTPDETFQLTLLCLAETTKNILLERCTNAKRKYWLDRMETAIEAINRTYDGYLPQDFINRSMKFNKWIETDMQALLKGFKDGNQ